MAAGAQRGAFCAYNEVPEPFCDSCPRLLFARPCFVIGQEVVKLAEAKRGFVLLPRRWVVERDFAWLSRFRRLARDYERLPEMLAGLHLIACVILNVIFW